jgi:hypothetical protein
MMNRLALLALPLCLLLLPVAFGLPDEAVGRVVSVISGDSLGVMMMISDEGTNGVDRITLADIAAPSTITDEGKAAKDYSLSVLKNKLIYIDINNNSSSRRNKWNQLICVIYLVDPEFRPVWPPVNRILVDGGFAKLNDDHANEFNSSAWWQKSHVFMPTKKRDLLAAMLEKIPQSKEMFFAGPLPSPANFVVINSQLNASGNVSASNAAKSNLTASAAKGRPASDKVRKTSMLDAKKVASTLSATKGRAASIAVPDNSTSCTANGTSLSSGVPVNSTSHIAMENTTASKMQINSTSLVVPGVSESGTTKKDPRSVSILEKDKTSGRISIGYRK